MTVHKSNEVTVGPVIPPCDPPCLDWPQLSDLPALASWVLGSQACPPCWILHSLMMVQTFDLISCDLSMTLKDEYMPAAFPARGRPGVHHGFSEQS